MNMWEKYYRAKYQGKLKEYFIVNGIVFILIILWGIFLYKHTK